MAREDRKEEIAPRREEIAAAQREGKDVGSLTQIEKVLFLQGVEVFSYCSASQILRIASIAHEQRFASGEEVFSLNDAADSIYCIVEGSVKLENAFNESAVVEQNATFGLLDILNRILVLGIYC